MPKSSMFLDAFWIDFWSIFDRFLTPKIHKKSIKKSLQKLIAFGIDFGSIFGGFCLPNGGWKGLGFLYIFAVGALLGPRWAPDPSKRPPGSILDRFWMDFASILDQFWMVFELILNDFSMSLVMFLIILDINPIRQWMKQSINQSINQSALRPKARWRTGPRQLDPPPP